MNLFKGLSKASHNDIIQLLAELKCKQLLPAILTSVSGTIFEDNAKNSRHQQNWQMINAIRESKNELRTLSRSELEHQLRDELRKFVNANENISDVNLSILLLRKVTADLQITGCPLPSQQAYAIMAWWATRPSTEDSSLDSLNINSHIKAARHLFTNSQKAFRLLGRLRSVVQRKRTRKNLLQELFRKLGPILDGAQILWDASTKIHDVWNEQKYLLPSVVAVAMLDMEDELQLDDSTLPSWVEDEEQITVLQRDEGILSIVEARDIARNDYRRWIEEARVAIEQRDATQQLLTRTEKRRQSSSNERTQQQEKLPELRKSLANANAEVIKFADAEKAENFFERLRISGQYAWAIAAEKLAAMNVSGCENAIESLVTKLHILDNDITHIRTSLIGKNEIVHESELAITTIRHNLFTAEERVREQLAPICNHLTTIWKDTLPNFTALPDCLLWIASRPYHERLAIERMLIELHRDGNPAAFAVQDTNYKGTVQYPHSITSPDEPWRITVSVPAPYRMDFPLSDITDASLYYSVSDSGHVEGVWIGDIRPREGAETIGLQDTPDTIIRHNLQEMRQALLEEIAAQQRDQSHSERISNGQRVSNAFSKEILYSFNLPQSREIIPETPILLVINDHTPISGRWVGQHESTVLLAIPNDIGEKVAEASLTVQPGFIYHRLYEILQQLSEASEERLKLMKFLMRLSTLPTSKDESAATRMLEMLPIEKHPNADQQEAIAYCAGSPLHFVWGPPGTGKTTCLAQVASLLADRGEKVLVLSHTNIAVDVAMQKIFEIAQCRQTDMNGKLLRIGTPQAPDFPDAMRLEWALEHRYPELIAHQRELEKQLTFAVSQSQGRQVQELLDRLQDVRDELDDVEAQCRQLESQLIEEAQIVGATLSRLVIDQRLFDYDADTIIVDEASIAILPMLMFSAFLASKRLLVFGDFRQLPPICISPKRSVKRWLGRDAFEVSGVRANIEEGHACKAVTLLATQYRMAPQISEIVNHFAYGGRLVTPDDAGARTANISGLAPCSGKSVVLLNTTAMKPSCVYDATPQSSSRVNPLHAALVSSLLSEIDCAQTSVGVITPYRAQVQLLRAICSNRSEIQIATVHRFQGRECDVAIIDLVDAWPIKGASYLTGRDTDLALRLLNVAISRPRGKVIIIADVDFILRCHEENSPARKLIELVRANNCIVDVPLSVVSDNVSGDITWYESWQEAAPEVINQLNDSTKRCVINLPGAFSSTYRVSINNCHTRGVTVDDYTDNSKSLCPFVFIDNHQAFVGGLSIDSPVAHIDSSNFTGRAISLLIAGTDRVKRTDVKADSPKPKNETSIGDKEATDEEMESDYCDASCLHILSQCEGAGIPKPEVGYELADTNGCIIAYAELAWPVYRIAVLLSDQEEFRDQFIANGWQILSPESFTVEPFHQILTNT